MQSSILLITADIKSFPLDVVQRKLKVRIVLVPNRRSALAALPKREFSLVVAADQKSDENCIGSAVLMQNAGGAAVVELNFDGLEISRIVHQIRAALDRALYERERARQAAIAALQGELRSSLSGLLLESQLALRESDSASRPKIANLVFLAGQLSERLKFPVETNCAAPPARSS